MIAAPINWALRSDVSFAQVRDSGRSRRGDAAGARPPPQFSQKYFKKSPKLAKIDQKILGASPQNTGCTPFLQILDPPGAERYMS